MNHPFLPTWMAEDVTQITPEFLKRNNIKLLMLDFDNTLIPYTTNVPAQEVVSWLHRVLDSGVILCVVSNSYKDRVKDFCRKYQIPCICGAKKPFADGINRCMSQFAVAKEKCAFLGDQIFTDTLGGNCAGVRTILVRSIDNHTFWLKLRHLFEKPFIYAARNRRI